MCLALIMSTSKEIEINTINSFKNENVYINKVNSNNILSIFCKRKDNLYMITDGMCSCDFFQRRGNKRIIGKNILLLRQLINSLYKEGNYIKIYVHQYAGKYEDEFLSKPHKEKISLDNLLSLVGDIKQDVLYIIY